jgi:hypothetical protein
MKVNKNTKRILLGVLAFFVLSFVVLVIHVVMVSKSIKYDNPSLQLARIDFKQPIDSSQAREINTKIRKIDGVGNTHFNLKDGILIYSVDNNKNSDEAVYEKLVSEVPYKAERFLVTNEMAAKGCPAMDKSSFAYQFSNTVNKIFN